MTGQADFAADAGCVRLEDASTGAAYYLTLDVHEDKQDLEQSSFNLKVTDGSRAWKVDGAPQSCTKVLYLILHARGREDKWLAPT